MIVSLFNMNELPIQQIDTFVYKLFMFCYCIDFFIFCILLHISIFIIFSIIMPSIGGKKSSPNNRV